MNNTDYNGLNVCLGDRSYPIIIAEQLLQSHRISEYIAGNQALIISSEPIAKHYLSRVVEGIRQHRPQCQLDELLLPDGEPYKTLDSFSSIIDTLIASKHRRTSTLIALGGGVIGDITGYAAASYQRGINFIQIPTSLLAQVDASVGGKTGVNHPLGKNMIGAFHQPQAVFIDTETLATLPAREFNAGLAEIIKYGLIHDVEFLQWIQDNISSLQQQEPAALAKAITQSCRIKAEIVALDERELGIRAILNFGHTFGHAIETLTHYQQFLHGEAVAIGMAMAADFSQRLGYLEAAEVRRVERMLTLACLPTKLPAQINKKELMTAMSADKKAHNDRLRFVVLSRLGTAKLIDRDYELALEACLHRYCGNGQ